MIGWSNDRGQMAKYVKKFSPADLLNISTTKNEKQK